MKKNTITIILTLIISILLVSFTLQNAGYITIKLWFWEIESPIALILLISVIAIILINLLFNLPSYFKNKKNIKKKEKVIAEKEREIKILTQKLMELEEKLKTKKNTEEVQDEIKN